MNKEIPYLTGTYIKQPVLDFRLFYNYKVFSSMNILSFSKNSMQYIVPTLFHFVDMILAAISFYNYC